MDITFLLFQNLIPLYILIALGWVAGRYFEIDVKSISSLVINILAPVAIFGFFIDIDLETKHFFLPFLTWGISSVIAIIFLTLGRKIYNDNRANLLAIISSTGNAGFFGFPLALALMPKNTIALYVLADIGGAIYLSTVMYYIAARGQFSARESLLKLSKFPILYGVILGVIVNALNITLPTQFHEYHDYFVGALILSGMMILGISISQIKTLSLSKKFLSWALIGKFIVWPSIVFGLILLDKIFFHIFETSVHQIMFIISIVPHGISVAAYAAQFDLHPEKAATTILIGTLLALLTMPLMLALSGLF